MKRVAYVFLFLGVCSCVWYSKKSILDVTKEQDLLLMANNKTPTGCRLKIKGEVNDSFSLYIFERTFNLDRNSIELYRHYAFPKGKVDTFIRDDWYQDTLRMKYVPKNVTSGYLDIYHSID